SPARSFSLAESVTQRDAGLPTPSDDAGTTPSKGEYSPVTRSDLQIDSRAPINTRAYPEVGGSGRSDAPGHSAIEPQPDRQAREWGLLVRCRIRGPLGILGILRTILVGILRTILGILRTVL